MRWWTSTTSNSTTSHHLTPPSPPPPPHSSSSSSSLLTSHSFFYSLLLLTPPPQNIRPERPLYYYLKEYTKIEKHWLENLTKFTRFSVYLQKNTLLPRSWLHTIVYICYLPAARSGWEKLCPRSWKRPEHEGRRTFSRPRAQFFSSGPTLSVNNLFIFYQK